MKQKLNDDQRALVEENMHLVYYHVYNRIVYRERRDEEDVLQIGMIGLCKAAATFDPGKGFTFSTYALRCIENEIRMYANYERRRRAERLGPRLEQNVSKDDECADLTLADFVPSIEDVDSAMALMSLKDTITRCAPGKDGEILRMHLDGMEQKDIGRRVGVSQSLVSRRIKAVRNRIRLEHMTV